jgi:PAS domain S-box-containing protein
MKNIRLGLGTKIFMGFFVLILIFIFNGTLSVFTLDKSKAIITNNSDNIDPSLEAINEFSEMVINSKMLATNWVYLQVNKDDKQALKQLHNVDYPALNARMKSIYERWSDTTQRATMDALFVKFEELLVAEKSIMEEHLVSFDDYDDPMKKMIAEEIIESQVIPYTASLMEDLTALAKEKRLEAQTSRENLLSSFNTLRNQIIILAIIVTVISVVSAFITATSITRPLNYIKKIIEKLGRGELAQDSTRVFNKDEIGEMALAVEQLVKGLKETSLFAENIGSGNLKASFTPLSENDVLGNALLEMRSNLQKVAEEDSKRNWATEGQAKFGELLRTNNNNIAKLSDDIIQSLVKYLNANQGGLFIVQSDDTEDPYLTLTGCYAWDKKKYIDQQVHYGEGLTGQAWQEKDTIFITDVPEDYITITSGLGEANPTSILIVPLKVNDEVYGVVEMASFYEFEPHQIEFVEKIGESIASTISTARINERTSRLLEDSQMLTEQMRAQEEEMRQNMEELQATQEEMQRSQRDAFDKERLINSTSIILELDANFKVINNNQLASTTLGYSQSELLGMSFNKLVDNSENISAATNRLAAGKSWKGIVKLRSKNGVVINAKVSADALTTDSGERYLAIFTDVTELVIS